MIGVITWLLQRVSGVILVAGLLIHFYLMHFSGPEQLTYASVTNRLSNPFWIAFNVIFLLSAIYHGFNGLWGIALEYVSSLRLLRFFQTFILIAASALSATGIYILAI